MTVDDWVHEALEAAGQRGGTLRDVQRWIDEHRGEELAMDTLEASLHGLIAGGRAKTLDDGRYAVQRKSGQADALKRLFGE